MLDPLIDFVRKSYHLIFEIVFVLNGRAGCCSRYCLRYGLIDGPGRFANAIGMDGSGDAPCISIVPWATAYLFWGDPQKSLGRRWIKPV
jgi:hypothetical protein